MKLLYIQIWNSSNPIVFWDRWLNIEMVVMKYITATCFIKDNAQQSYIVLPSPSSNRRMASKCITTAWVYSGACILYISSIVGLVHVVSQPCLPLDKVKSLIHLIHCHSILKIAFMSLDNFSISGVSTYI